MRKNIISNILHTDMKRHFDIIEKSKILLADISEGYDFSKNEKQIVNMRNFNS